MHASLLPFQHPSESSQLSISDGLLHGIYNNSWMEKSLDFDYIFKYILIGDSSVGKSTILSMFINNSYLADSNPTMGV
jgi:GTP-binding protein EngB required for normal cell division